MYRYFSGAIQKNYVALFPERLNMITDNKWHCYARYHGMAESIPSSYGAEMPVSRTHMLAKLDDAYTVFFDRKNADPGTPFLASCYAFHSADECFVLSRKVKLWRAEINEFVYIFSMEELTAEFYETCRQRAFTLGMQEIHPHLEHRSSFITAIFLCDHVQEEAAHAVRTTRCHKDFLFSLHGWMDLRAAALDLGTGIVTVNRAGQDLSEFLRGNMGKCSLIEEEKQ